MNTQQIQEQINQLCTIIDDQQEQIEKLKAAITNIVEGHQQLLSQTATLGGVLTDHRLASPDELQRGIIKNLASIDQLLAAERDGLA